MSDPTFRPGSDEEWQALLHRLRQQPKAQPQPFFYARVQARLLRQAATTAGLPAWLRRPIYAAVLGALVLIVSGDNSSGPVSSNAHAFQVKPPLPQ